MAPITVEEKRAKRMLQLQHNIEAQIMMIDDSDDMMLFGMLCLNAAKNIFFTRHTKEHTRQVLHKYVDDVCN